MKRLVLIAMLFLAGCGGPRDVGNENKLALPSLARQGKPAQQLGVVMLVYPAAPTDLDTYRIAVLRDDGRQDYIAGARWTDFLPEIMRASLQDTLKNSGAFSFVEQDDGRIDAPYALHTQINKFTVSYATPGKPPLIDVSLTFSLQHVDGTALARFTSERKIEATTNTMNAIASAFDEAFLGVERELVRKVTHI
jgi:ABC-type uncharacterized transport system auxiliary subunit